ncbi:MAG: hypothetical protein ACJAQT_000658 [Akkermansiaceae bacterium]
MVVAGEITNLGAGFRGFNGRVSAGETLKILSGARLIIFVFRRGRHFPSGRENGQGRMALPLRVVVAILLKLAKGLNDTSMGPNEVPPHVKGDPRELSEGQGHQGRLMKFAFSEQLGLCPTPSPLGWADMRKAFGQETP